MSWQLGSGFNWVLNILISQRFTFQQSSLLVVRSNHGWTVVTIRIVSRRLLYPWRIHGAAIYGAPWIPSIYPKCYIPAPWILWVTRYQKLWQALRKDISRVVKFQLQPRVLPLWIVVGCGFRGPWLSDALSRSTLGVWFGCWDATPRSDLGLGGSTVHLSFDSPLYAPWCWMVLEYLPTFALKTTQM